MGGDSTPKIFNPKKNKKEMIIKLAKYELRFKLKAVKLLRTLNEKGIVKVNNTEINNVRELVKTLGCSNDALYTWDKKYPTKKKEGDIEEEDIEIEIQKIKVELPGENKKDLVKFGIDFYMHYARNLGIHPYRISLKQLKLKIGMELIKQSGLINNNKVREHLRLGDE